MKNDAVTLRSSREIFPAYVGSLHQLQISRLIVINDQKVIEKIRTNQVDIIDVLIDGVF